MNLDRRSISQNAVGDALPDFRNLGVIVRSLLAVNALALFAATVRRGDILSEFTIIAYAVEPALFASLAVLYVARDALARLPAVAGVACTLAIVAALSAATSWLEVPGAQAAGPGAMGWRVGYALVFCALMIGYFRLRSRAFSPALAEARLQALQARIRPHFLFNSLNAVLSLIRRDAARAEAALEDLADLFRNLMADNRNLTTLESEVSLCRQYLSLESLRLGERLHVQWRLDPQADRALVPAMLLQPLVENAVYHGIEPGIGPGTIEIETRREGERLRLRLTNPCAAGQQHRQGSRMALANIRERLQLHFDVEASLETAVSDGRYRISIAMPYRSSP